MTGAEAIRKALPRLKAVGVADPARDVRYLMAHALDVRPDRLLLEVDAPLSSDAAARFEIAIARRIAREPVSHITGRRMFWGREFRLDAGVLDPRPETETLVALALTEPFERVLDLGTGTGCILVTLLAERPTAIGTGTDISPAARAHALGNAIRNKVSDRAEIVDADWFTPREGQGPGGRYDLIVSNPPYIAADEMAALACEVRDHEPALALTDGADGLSAYRAIASGVTRHLTSGGRLLVEIGPTQGRAVSDLFAMAGLEEITVHPDMDGRDRVVAARG